MRCCHLQHGCYCVQQGLGEVMQAPLAGSHAPTQIAGGPLCTPTNGARRQQHVVRPRAVHHVQQRAQDLLRAAATPRPVFISGAAGWLAGPTKAAPWQEACGHSDPPPPSTVCLGAQTRLPPFPPATAWLMRSSERAGGSPHAAAGARPPHPPQQACHCLALPCLGAPVGCRPWQ